VRPDVGEDQPVEHEIAFDAPKNWTTTSMREHLTAALEDIATLLDPGRPPLGEPEVGYESEELSDMGETSDTTTWEYAGLLCVREHETGINDGATPSSSSFQGEAVGLPADCAVSFRASHRSPVHVQPSRVTVSVTTPGDELPAAVAERLDRLRRAGTATS
jgi:hypothetical protein